MTDRLLHLRRSENGHFVLTEPTSQTVVVAEELGEGYTRMCATLQDAPPPAPPRTGSPAVFVGRGAVRLVVVVAALLAPLAWMASIAFEVRHAELSCPLRATRSEGHPTHVTPTPSAAADREGLDEDVELDDDTTAGDPKPAAQGAPSAVAPAP